jgi:GNAT superfamily N-acetyltransferase
VEIIIREMNKFDSIKCKDLSIQLGYPDNLADFDKRFSLINKLPHHHLVVAEALNEKLVVALMHLEIRYLLVSSFKVQISALIVDERMRGQGIGKKLLTYAENWTKNCGFKDIFLYSNIVKDESHTFYMKYGYQNSKDSKMFSKILDRNGVQGDIKVLSDLKQEIKIDNVKLQ